ncbi:MAG: Rab family GTPase [Promethearchaeota archaeon]|jgi:small GTP-binding protein
MSYRGKVILCGDPSVGKTSILARYVDGQFTDDYNQTIGANFLIKEIELGKIVDKLNISNPKLKKDIKDKGFRLYFWDLGGQHDKLFSNEYYFVQAVGAFIVYDVINRESFDNIEFWISKLKELSGEIPFIIIGNKIDKKDERLISFEEAKEKSKSYNVQYMETSAKSNENIDKAFESLSVQILNNLK